MIRKKFFIPVFIILSLLLLNGFAQAEKSFLWKIETAKGNSYLLGSVHVLKKEIYPLRPIIEDAFAQTDLLAVEADMSSEKMGQAAMLVLTKGSYQGEETLKDNLSEKTYQLLESKLKEMGSSIDDFIKYKPWMVASVMLQQALAKLGFNPTNGIDFHFLNKAAEAKKPIFELEGIEYQLNLFNSFSKAEMEKFLLSSIVESDQSPQMFEQLVATWQKGDVEHMEKLLTENISQYPDLNNFYEKLIDVRNKNMTEKIDKLLKEGKKVMVVVGAAHMVGKEGIVQLLINKGYKVSQL